MLGRRCFHCRRIVPHALGDDFSFPKVGADDLRNILHFDFAIPDAFGIDDHNWPVIAQAKATACAHLNFVIETLRTQFTLQSLNHAPRPVAGTAGNSFGFFLCADEDVVAKRLHGCLPRGWARGEFGFHCW